MNLFKMMGALKDRGKIQEEMKTTADALALMRHEGSAGGGLVTVVANGSQQLLECRIDPKAMEDADPVLLQELFLEAANHALSRAREATAETMQKTMADKFDLPGMDGLLKNFLPK